MSDSLQALLMANTTKANSFPITSRYYGVETAQLEPAGGRTIVFLRRRFVPSADRFLLLQNHTVVQGERMDHIAARYLGDPEQFWRLCDANNAMRPEELTKNPGRQLRITMPEGITGPTL
ncbi:MAG: LysM peptidoglycan-binding domain-containing protein [Opitutaceae bacterium]|nr:LysM peptidoglycan-binding domain-containing protein [Verrucomicrobiales bacterium]